MIYKPENVKLVITHNGVEQEVSGITDYPISFDEATCPDDCSVVSEEQTECVFHKVSKTKGVSKKAKSKSSRCKDTIDCVEVEYGDAYEKPHVNKKAKESSQSGKQSISSTLVKQLTKSEIESLRQNKRDAYALMMKMD